MDLFTILMLFDFYLLDKDTLTFSSGSVGCGFHFSVKKVIVPTYNRYQDDVAYEIHYRHWDCGAVDIDEEESITCSANNAFRYIVNRGHFIR